MLGLVVVVPQVEIRLVVVTHVNKFPGIPIVVTLLMVVFLMLYRVILF